MVRSLDVCIYRVNTLRVKKRQSFDLKPDIAGETLRVLYVCYTLQMFCVDIGLEFFLYTIYLHSYRVVTFSNPKIFVFLSYFSTKTCEVMFRRDRLTETIPMKNHKTFQLAQNDRQVEMLKHISV